MNHPLPARLALCSLTVDVPGTTLVRELSLSLQPGDRLAVLGRNGVGKTLTLHTIAGLRDAACGTVEIDGRSIQSMNRREIAQHLTLVQQDTTPAFPEFAIERVISGRHPHLSRWQWESGNDRRIALLAMRRMGIEHLAQRDILSLSGGERQRVALAQALAQEPAIFLLDEPTNHLDLRHQQQVLGCFSDLAAKGAVVVVTLHDVNLAAGFANRFLLLFGNGDWRFGDADDVLTEASLAELLDVPIERHLLHDGRSAFFSAAAR